MMHVKRQETGRIPGQCPSATLVAQVVARANFTEDDCLAGAVDDFRQLLTGRNHRAWIEQLQITMERRGKRGIVPFGKPFSTSVLLVHVVASAGGIAGTQVG